MFLLSGPVDDGPQSFNSVLCYAFDFFFEIEFVINFSLQEAHLIRLMTQRADFKFSRRNLIFLIEEYFEQKCAFPSRKNRRGAIFKTKI